MKSTLHSRIRTVLTIVFVLAGALVFAASSAQADPKHGRGKSEWKSHGHEWVPPGHRYDGPLIVAETRYRQPRVYVMQPHKVYVPRPMIVVPNQTVVDVVFPITLP